LTDSRLSIPDDVIYLGYVEKTHGLKGGLRVRLFQGYGTSEVPVGTVVLLDGRRPLTVSRCTYYGDSRFNLTFREIRSKQEAEDCRDCSIFIEMDDSDQKKLGFIPLYRFSGMEIHSRGSTMKVIDVEPAGANPMLVVESGENRFHVPVILVVHEGSINWKEKEIMLDLPEGLEELSI
jgi:ribosomal 30S subunit maturation factor RimM